MNDTMTIDLSLCPTLFENGWGEEAVLNSIRDYAAFARPEAEFVRLQVGQRQGDFWCHVRVHGFVDEVRSDDFYNGWWHTVDGADESLYYSPWENAR